MIRPPVTVMLVVHDNERFLAEAIGSVLDQSYRDLELLVVDDGSTDGSVAIVRDFQRRDPSIRLCLHGRNRGIGAARRTGVLEARTAWVMPFDGDDRMLPGCIQTQLDHLERNPGAKVISGRAYYVSATGKRIGLSTVVPLSAERLLELVQRCEPFGLMQPTTLMHRPTVIAAGNYKEELTSQEDGDLWARIAEQGHLIVTHSSLLFEYRMHSASSTTTTGTLFHVRYLWVAARMRCRRDGLPEVSWEQFQRELAERPALQRLLIWRDAMTRYLYREAGRLRGEGAWPGVFWRLALAFVLAPWFVLRRLRKVAFGR